VTSAFGQHGNRSSRRPDWGVALLALLICGALLVGCGSSSSKPAYCSAVSKVESALKSLPSAEDVKKNGVGTLKSAFSQLQQNATTAVNQAKSDFSSQTTALKSSLDALSSTVTQIASSPSAQTIAQLPAQLSAVGTAAKDLQSAVSSKCG
jgi:hypothetical protein